MNHHDVNTLSALVFQFFKGLDTRDHRTTAQFMASDGIWKRQGVDFVGPDAVLTMLETRDPTRRTAHLINNLWVAESTATTVQLRYYVTAFESVVAADGKVGPTQIAGILDSTDDLMLEDGQWRIQHKSTQRVLAAG
jgi:hypothetical protein